MRGSGPAHALADPRAHEVLKEEPMRWIYVTVIILFVAATVIFAFQNFETVTMSFLGFNVRAPLALLSAVIYLLGAATGGSLLALLRRSYEASRQDARSL